MARWLTLAIRILSLYCRTKEPSKELQMLVDYIQNIYGPFWFRYKCSRSWLEGPQILFDMIQDMKAFSIRWPAFKNIFEELKKVVQRNAFCCQLENFLTALVFSKDRDNRVVGVDAVLKIRKKGEVELKPTRTPKLNFEASSWASLINLDDAIKRAHSPSCLRRFSDEMIFDQIRFPASYDDLFPNYPIHSQSVERAVKLTSEFAKRCYKIEDQRKFIISTVASRKMRPIFDNKSTYEVKNFDIKF